MFAPWSLVLLLLHALPALSSISSGPNDACKTLLPRSSSDDDMVNAVISELRQRTMGLQQNFCATCIEASLELYIEGNKDPNFAGMRRVGLNREQAEARRMLKDTVKRNIVSFKLP